MRVFLGICLMLLWSALSAEPSLHILLTSIGRSTLIQMLDSLEPQLQSCDFLTVVFDGKDESGVYEEAAQKLKKFSCHVDLKMEEKNLGFWGHVIRNKYNELSGDFVMHADDDDVYAEGALSAVRAHCVDTNTLYIFQMLRPDGSIVTGNPLEYGNISSQIAVIPTAYNALGKWGFSYAGDFIFYHTLSRSVPAIEYVDHVIYHVRPGYVEGI